MNRPMTFPRARRQLRIPLLLLFIALLFSAAISTVDAAPANQTGTYTVQRGDTLLIISRQTGTSLSNLINLNGPSYPSLFTNPNLIFPGWVFKLAPGATTPTSSTPAATVVATYTVKRGDWLSQIARTTGTSPVPSNAVKRAFVSSTPADMMPRRRWYLKLRLTVLMPLASNADAMVSP